MTCDCVHGQLARSCVICALEAAIVRWVRSDRAWTLSMGMGGKPMPPGLQDEMDQATYELHAVADELDRPPKPQEPPVILHTGGGRVIRECSVDELEKDAL